jgi:hypothetical protein
MDQKINTDNIFSNRTFLEKILTLITYSKCSLVELVCEQELGQGSTLVARL